MTICSPLEFFEEWKPDVDRWVEWSRANNYGVVITEGDWWRSRWWDYFHQGGHGTFDPRWLEMVCIGDDWYWGQLWPIVKAYLATQDQTFVKLL